MKSPYREIGPNYILSKPRQSMKNPKHILITGGSSGIGEALALHYAAPEVMLSLSGRNAERLEAVCSACREVGAEASGEALDVRDRGAMARWIESADAKLPIDLVVANAGTNTTALRVGDLSEAADQVFDINVGGVFNTLHPALSAMRARGRGQIAIVSSIAGYQGLAATPAYSASKAAIKAYGEALRGRYEREGVEINVICPGFVVSRMTAVNKHEMPFLLTAEKAAKIIARGLGRNRGRITFPWQMTMVARLWINLPMWLIDRVARVLPEK